MPYDYRADFPALTVEVHEYNKESARRFIAVNGQIFIKGQLLPQGQRVIEIPQNGIVLEYRGEKVFYPIGH